MCADRWRPRLLLSDGDRRDLLNEAVSEQVGDAAQIEWSAPGRGWSAHVRVQGSTGLVGYLLTSPEWRKARFEQSHLSTFEIAGSDDSDDLQAALRRFARAAVEYVSDRGQFEHKRGLLGTRATRLPSTRDVEWRIGRRMTHHPCSPY